MISGNQADFHYHINLGPQASETLLMMTEAYWEIVDSGDCRSRPITGNNSDEQRNCLHGGCEHIFAKEKSAIFNGDSFTASFLLGFRATTEQSATNFSKAYKTKPTHIIIHNFKYDNCSSIKMVNNRKKLWYVIYVLLQANKVLESIF